MVVNIPHAITFDMCHVVCNDIPHDHVVCFLTMYDFWPCGMLFQNHRKLQFRIFEGQKYLKPWHIKKTKCVWCIGHTAFVGRPALLSCGTAAQQTRGVWPTHHTIITFLLIHIPLWRESEKSQTLVHFYSLPLLIVSVLPEYRKPGIGRNWILSFKVLKRSGIWWKLTVALEKWENIMCMQ